MLHTGTILAALALLFYAAQGQSQGHIGGIAGADLAYSQPEPSHAPALSASCHTDNKAYAGGFIGGSMGLHMFPAINSTGSVGICSGVSGALPSTLTLQSVPTRLLC